MTMRMSVDSSDPDFHPGAWLCRVFLEGVERNNVITADEERRLAVLYKLDQDGRYIEVDGKLATETFYGAVLIVPPDSFPPYTPPPASVWAPLLAAAGLQPTGDGCAHYTLPSDC